MGLLSEQGKKGDEKIAWDPRDQVATSRARNRFAELIGQGYKAYRINHAGGKGEHITEFDPLAHEITMHRIMSGG